MWSATESTTDQLAALLSRLGKPDRDSLPAGPSGGEDGDGTIRVDHEMARELRSSEQFALSARAPRRVRGYPQLSSYRLQRAKKHPASRRVASPD